MVFHFVSERDVLANARYTQCPTTRGRTRNVQVEKEKKHINIHDTKRLLSFSQACPAWHGMAWHTQLPIHNHQKAHINRRP